MTLDDESGRNGIHKPLGGNCDTGDVVNMGEHDEKFVSSYPGYGVPFTGTAFEPFCNVLQKEVSHRMPERVVDYFEAVEINEQKSDFVLLPTSSGECI